MATKYSSYDSSSGNIFSLTTITGQSGVFTSTLSGNTITGNSGLFTYVTGATLEVELGTIYDLAVTSGYATGLICGSGEFTYVSGTTVTGVTGQFTALTGDTAGFTTVTGVTVTGSTGNFNIVSGATITGVTGQFTALTGNTAGFTTVSGTKFDVSGFYIGNVADVSALNIDCTSGNYFIKTITGDSTFTVSNIPASGRSYGMTLEITHTSGAITWFSGVEWPSSTPPTLTTGKTHLFIFVTDDGGSRWRGASLVDYVN